MTQPRARFEVHDAGETGRRLSRAASAYKEAEEKALALRTWQGLFRSQVDLDADLRRAIESKKGGMSPFQALGNIGVAYAGETLGAAQKVIPGQQGYERRLAEAEARGENRNTAVAREYGAFEGARVNVPAGQAMSLLGGGRFQPLPLPGGRSFGDVSLGTKGAFEQAIDPFAIGGVAGAPLTKAAVTAVGRGGVRAVSTVAREAAPAVREFARSEVGAVGKGAGEAAGKLTPKENEILSWLETHNVQIRRFKGGYQLEPAIEGQPDIHTRNAGFALQRLLNVEFLEARPDVPMAEPLYRVSQKGKGLLQPPAAERPRRLTIQEQNAQAAERTAKQLRDLETSRIAMENRPVFSSGDKVVVMGDLRVVKEVMTQPNGERLYRVEGLNQVVTERQVRQPPAAESAVSKTPLRAEAKVAPEAPKAPGETILEGIGRNLYLFGANRNEQARLLREHIKPAMAQRYGVDPLDVHIDIWTPFPGGPSSEPLLEAGGVWAKRLVELGAEPVRLRGSDTVRYRMPGVQRPTLAVPTRAPEAAVSTPRSSESPTSAKAGVSEGPAAAPEPRVRARAPRKVTSTKSRPEAAQADTAQVIPSDTSESGPIARPSEFPEPPISQPGPPVARAAQAGPTSLAPPPPPQPPSAAGAGAPRSPNFQAGPRAAVREIPPPPPLRPPGPPPVGGLPSGRQPGGPQNSIPLAEPDPLQQVREALTPTPDPLLARVLDMFSASKWIDSNHILEGLSTRTGIPVHKMAQIVNGAYSKGENVLRQRVSPILDALPAKDIARLEEYMVLMRGDDIMARNPQARLPNGILGRHGLTRGRQKLQAEMGPERYQAVQQAADALWRVNTEEVLDYYVQNGILSPRQETAILSAHPHYIPYAREDFNDALGKTFNGDRSVASVSSTGIPQMDLGGSERKLDRALSRFLSGPVKARMVVARNDAAKAIVEGLQAEQARLGEPLVFEVDETGRVARAANIAGQTKPNMLREAEHSGQWDTISYFADGEKRTYQIPTPYAEVARGLDKETTGLLNTVASVLNKPIRAGAVTFNIAFLPRNVLRDLQSLWQIEGWGAMGSYLDGWAAAITKNTDFNAAANAGTFMSGIVENMRGRTALQIAERYGGMKAFRPADALLFLPRLLESANIVGERATRIAVYKSLRGHGLNELDAAIRSRNVTVDFSKSGSVMRVVNQVVPFSNAAVQGTVNTLGAIKRHPVRSLAIAGGTFGTATVLSRVNNMRFPTADQIPNYEYTRAWVIVVAEGTKKDGTRFPIYIKLPKGTFAGVATAPMEALFTFAQANNDRSAAALLLEAVKGQSETVSPVTLSAAGFLPSPIQTGIGIAVNQDLYGGRAIVSRSQQGLPSEQQFSRGTSATAIALGQATRTSPALIDFALTKVAGGAGAQTNWLASLGLEALGYAPPPVFGEAVKPEEQQTGLEEALGSPFVRPLIGTRDTRELIQGYADLDAKVLETNRAFNQLPDMNRLGIRLGSVGDSIDLTPGVAGGSYELTPDQRARYQQLMADEVIPKLSAYAARPAIRALPDDRKRAALQKGMADIKAYARDKAKATIIGPALTAQRAKGGQAPTPQPAPPSLAEKKRRLQEWFEKHPEFQPAGAR